MKQNKVEKLLAGVLSIALAMGVSVMPAFAASGETYADMDSVVIKKNYELANEGTFSPAETFSFDIEADNVTDASDDITPENMPMPTIGTVSYLRGEAGSTTKTKEIKIDLPEYDSVGVYTYIIHEAAGNSAGVTYYGDAILLRVTVIEQDGKLRIAAVHTEDPESTGEGKKDDFDNFYSAGELEVHKDVEGIMGNKEKYFEFRVQLTGEEGKTYQDSYAITGGSYGANPASIEIKPGETTEATFYLKDGDTIHIENLPYGVEYKVSETPVADYVTTEKWMGRSSRQASPTPRAAPWMPVWCWTAHPISLP